MAGATPTDSPLPPWAARHPRLVGALTLLALHALFLPLAGSYLGAKPEAGAFLIGFTQLYYVVPALILLMKLGRKEMAKGMALTAFATFVLNAGGCGLLMWQLSQIDG